MKRKSVLVVGGGLAGIAAAAALASENYQVTLVERRRYLGGRASAFPVENGWLDNCQHVILGSCINILDLLDRLGNKHLVTFYRDIPFVANGQTTVLRPSGLPIPLHFLPSFLRARLFTFKEKMKVLRLFAGLARVDRNDPTLDQITLLTWLKEHGQSEKIIENFWNLIFISSLNETLDRTSAKYGVMVLQESFMQNRDGALVGTPNVSLAELYHEAAKSLFEKQGVQLVHSNVKALELSDENPRVLLDDETVIEADELVSALPFYNLLPLLPERLRYDPYFVHFENLETSPILGIHLWFKQPVTAHPFGAFPGSPIHWFFSKPQEDDLHYVQLVISACRPFMDSSTEDLIKLGIQEIEKFLPQSKNVELSRAKIVREARATFSPKPGADRWRPNQETPYPHFYLAGDWTNTGWPATMEGAVISGYRTAESILRNHGTQRCFELHGSKKGTLKTFTKHNLS